MAYRILSLDGGGTWALIQVLALTALYDKNTRGNDVLADFDLVAATSGGSLVLGGLVENLALSDILAYFNDPNKRTSIFSPTGNFGDKVLEATLGFGPKYSAKRKLPAIETLMPARGTQPLTSAAAGIRRKTSATDVHLLITGFDYDRNRACFFRSSGINDPSWGQGGPADVTLAEAIHASTNAPVMYFDEAAGFPAEPFEHYWDGAISGCNNPVLAAVTEAISLNVAPQDIAALSIGTGTVVLPWAPGNPQPPFTEGPSNTGLLNDLQKLAGTICDDPPDVASFLAYVMTGGPVGSSSPPSGRIVRMNPLITPVQAADGSWTAPGGMSVAQFSYLANLHMDALQQSDVDYVSSYAQMWLAGTAPNQPIRMNSATLTPEIGHGWFKDAAAAWQSIKLP